MVQIFGSNVNKNFIREDIKNSLKSGNVCCHFLENLLFSSLLSKNIQIKVNRSIILSVVFCECETWSFTYREERSLRCSERFGLRGTM